MTYIKRITMTGFKSFGNRTVSVSFAKGFTCIVGPNGNGKSNVIDALCFALGRMSKKTMRAKSLTDLIFAGSKIKKPAGRAEVTVTFDNRTHEFPDESPEYSITRWVKKNGTSGYKLQGKNATREAILNGLAQANIDPDGSNQFVLQGKIVELTHMNTIARREFIETLIGLEKYDEMKEQTLKELEKADQDLGQFEAIFKEVSVQLKKVEKEKNDALRWKELDNQIRLYNAQLIALKIHKLRQEEAEISAEVEQTQLIIEEMENKIARQKERIEAESLLLKSIEEDISQADKEKQALSDQLTTQKADLSAKEATLQANRDTLRRLEQNITKLEELQEKLQEGQTYDDLVAQTTQEISLQEGKIEQTTEEIEQVVKEQKDREGKINAVNDEIAKINKEISKVEQDIKALTTENELLEKTIKKNDRKLEKMEHELSKLKKEGESVEEAIKATTKESEGIVQDIENLKNQIEAQKTQQKELDREIQKQEKERDKANKSLSDLQAAISSASAEINLLENRNKELDQNKKDYQKEYERLTKGQAVDAQIKELKKQEAVLQKDVGEAKEELRKLNEDQKKAEMKKDSIEVKRHSLEAEMTDMEKRISGLKVEIKNTEGDLKASDREKNELKLRKTNLDKELTELKAQQEKYSQQTESLNNKIIQMKEEREKIQEQISKKESEQESTSNELNSVMEALQGLMQNLDHSAGDIKSDIQNVSQVAIDKSAEEIKNLIDDVNVILSSIEEIAQLKEAPQIKKELDAAKDTLNLLVENSNQTIELLNGEVKEASDVALHESMKNFDGFILDFMEKFDAIRVALQAVGVSDTAPLYKSLDTLNEGIQNQSSLYAETSNTLTKVVTQIEQKEKETRLYEQQLNEIAKKMEDTQSRLEKATNENEDKTKLINKNQKEIAKLNSELEHIKTEDYFKKVSELSKVIDTKSEDLSKVIADLNALGAVKRILDDIENVSKEQEKNVKIIEQKQKQITDLSTSLGKNQDQNKVFLERITQLKQERSNADEQRNKCQATIDTQNEALKQVTAHLKDLENVQKLITDIENLKRENQEAAEKIQTNISGTEQLKAQIKAFEVEIAEKMKIIEGIQEERKKLEVKEREQREILKGFVDEKNRLEKKRDKQQQMLQRANEIEGLKNEIENLSEDIGKLEEGIQQLIDQIGKLEQTLIDKTNQLAALQTQKNQSWEKQKALQEELSAFMAESSKNSAKLNNLETRTLVISERVDELFEQSKDYGTLPPITEDLDENILNQLIAKSTTERTALEPVNLKSIEEYEQVKERWDEIDMRRQTLQRERKAILDSIERIELEKTRNFMKAFHEINRVFSEVFQKLSPGGSAKMMLENPAHPFEGGITIEARPRGKKISSLDILSGGEKTLVALSFIFAVQNFYPAPFYIMDEIDAALDGSNVYRTSMVIKEYAGSSQFIVISHREENITNADRIYGVSMNDGITDIFTVNLEEEKQRDDFTAPDEGTPEEEKDQLMVIEHDDNEEPADDEEEEPPAEKNE